MTARSEPGSEFDLSLRLWSNKVPLGRVIDDLGLARGPVHLAGQAGPRGRIARRHYAATAELCAGEDAVVPWSEDVLLRIAGAPALLARLGDGEIEATLWIAVFGPHPLPGPRLSDGVVRRARELGVGVLIENYTVLKNGNPARVWRSRPLLAPHALG